MVEFDVASYVKLVRRESCKADRCLVQQLLRPKLATERATVKRQWEPSSLAEAAPANSSCRMQLLNAIAEILRCMYAVLLHLSARHQSH